MTPSNSTMVLSIDPSGTLSDQSLHSASGYVNYIALLTSPAKAESFLERPYLPGLKSEGSTLFVSEAKGPDQRLGSHVPQALCEMHAYARTVGKATIRGVLTNGLVWIFLVSEGGGTYLLSSEINLQSGFTGELSRDAVSLVSAIIADWMVHSHEAVGVDDAYFTLT
ncbi:hypothetical protein FOMPIDRAFT_1043417 [Fomitopsis schrenkii]|uniref:Uncharacterized protein n=1 Tax=Fomitopsis schrenkii TaxID=2126942 RepID=S8F226_FOMSC|nr:hypothetical protein FOMPIDRAFT_1043417 [Fomitopsis schrenkii]